MGVVQTPTDQRSGAPLLIAPDATGRVPRVLQGRESNCGGVVNTQHVYHPWQQMTGSESLVMLHNAAGQEVLVEDHDEYHVHYGGPPLPTKHAERLRRTALHLAGYFPDQVIDVSRRGSPRVRPIKDSERERWRTSGELRVIAPDTVRCHLGSMLLENPGLAGLRASTVAKLLSLRPEESAADSKERERLTALLLRQLVQQSLSPMVGLYKQVFNNRQLSAEAPVDPDRLVVNFLLHSPKATKAMARRLVAALEALRDRQPA